jgi:hypothetical protein
MNKVNELVDKIVNADQDESAIDYTYSGNDYFIEWNNENYKFNDEEFKMLCKHLPAVNWQTNL